MDVTSISSTHASSHFFCDTTIADRHTHIEKKKDWHTNTQTIHEEEKKCEEHEASVCVFECELF
jgi:hypothetical protein